MRGPIFMKKLRWRFFCRVIRKISAGPGTVSSNATPRRISVSVIMAEAHQASLDSADAAADPARVRAHVSSPGRASTRRDPERARDLAQDILVAVWRAWPAFRGQCSERTYVARIAQYRIATHVIVACANLRSRRFPRTSWLSRPTPEDVVIRTRREHAPDRRWFGNCRSRCAKSRCCCSRGSRQRRSPRRSASRAMPVSIRGTRARELLRAALEDPAMNDGFRRTGTISRSCGARKAPRCLDGGRRATRAPGAVADADALAMAETVGLAARMSSARCGSRCNAHYTILSAICAGP